MSLDALAAGAAALGGDEVAVAAIRGANTAMEALEIARQGGLPLGDWVAAKARDVAGAEVDAKVDIEILIFDRAGETVGHAGFGTR